MNQVDSLMGVYDAPIDLARVALGDLIPLSGLITFSEGMRDRFEGPHGRAAPPQRARLEISAYPGCVGWQIPSCALPIHTVGEACAPSRAMLAKAPPYAAIH